jgi:uncharacterized protein
MDIERIPITAIKEFCRRWNIEEFSLFGSILRSDLGPESDVDVLVSLGDDTRLTLYDWVDMEDELKEIFNREIDLVAKSGLRNPFRKSEILRTRKVIYVSTGS